MIRILFYLLILAAAAYFADWLLQHPGHVDLDWFGIQVSMSAAVGFGLLLLVAIAGAILWSLLRFILGLPSFMMLARRQRRREKGYAALTRGLIAVGAGDSRSAHRASLVAHRHLKDDPLALVLQAEAARLLGDRARAEAIFAALAQREDTRLLGLRGLHDEAIGRGDGEAARHFAGEAHETQALPWSAESVLAHKAAENRWEEALSTVETSIQARLVDRAVGDRQRAVLETAIGLEKQDIAPDEALALARAAMKHAADLVPAMVLAARLYARKGEIRRASKLIEGVWPRHQHPELARVYLDVRPGDSTTDRLSRAQKLMQISSHDPVSRLTVARAAMAAKKFDVARDAVTPLIAEGQRPSVRTCLVMADLEDAEFGDQGHWREWLARASRAPLDPAWIADGIVYEQWEPVSPTTGRLDAFVWQAPADRPGQAMEAMPAPVSQALARTELVAPIDERHVLATETAHAVITQYTEPEAPAQSSVAEEAEHPASAAMVESEETVALAPPASQDQKRRRTLFKLRSTVAPDDPGVEGKDESEVLQSKDAPVSR